MGNINSAALDATTHTINTRVDILRERAHSLKVKKNNNKNFELFIHFFFFQKTKRMNIRVKLELKNLVNTHKRLKQCLKQR